MTFGYPLLYSNGLNSNSQIRRSADFIYQRGGTYEIVLTGDTYVPSMEMVVDLYSNGSKVGNMALVPYNITSGATYTYSFYLRPYNYLQAYVNTEHYQYYWLDDYSSTSAQINNNLPYPNNIQANFKYGYRYLNSSGGTVTEYASVPTNDFNHYTLLPDALDVNGYYPSGYTNTGNIFDYFGGTFQFDDNYILPNFDQEIGTIIGNGFSNNALSSTNRFSPIGNYLMDYPTVPEQSQTARFLTNAPRIQYIQDDENYVIWYINGQTGDRQVIQADFAVIEFYSGANTMLQRLTQEINTQSPTDFTDTAQRFAFPCGPVDLQNIFTGVTFDNVAYYRVQFYYGLPTWDMDRIAIGPIGPTSEIFYFYLYDNCLPENTRLCWLNDLGGYDYYTFQSYRQDTKKIDRTNYDSRYYSPALSSPDRNIGRSNKTFDTNISQEIVLTSNYLSVPESQWLESLFISPQVYIMRADYISPIDRQNKIYKDLRPVQVLSTEVDTMTKKHSKLNKYQITLKTGDSYFVNKGF